MQASIDPSDFQAVSEGMRRRLGRRVAEINQLKLAIRAIYLAWHTSRDVREVIEEAVVLVEQIEADEGGAL